MLCAILHPFIIIILQCVRACVRVLHKHSVRVHVLVVKNRTVEFVGVVVRHGGSPSILSLAMKLLFSLSFTLCSPN